MRLVLLTRSPRAHGNRRFVEEARARDWRLEVIDTLAPLVLPGSGELLLDGRPLGPVDAVLPRYGPDLQATGLLVQRALELGGAASLAPAPAFALARDKAASLQVFHAAGLPVPETALVCDAAQVEASLEAVGGGAVVVKPVRGWRGEGLRLFREPAEAARALLAEADARTPLLVQRFVEEAGGTSLRLLVVDGELVGGHRRRAAEGDFRTNAAAGGLALAWRRNEDALALALAATSAVGLRAAGVDLLETAAGPLLLEVNPAPGFAALEQLERCNPAAAFLSALER